MNIELTEDEAMNLRSLLDIAVRSQGMRAAEIAMVIDARIVAAAQKEEQQSAKQEEARPIIGNGQRRPGALG